MEAFYHPDPEINFEITHEAIAAEVADLKIGYPPRWWMCPECGNQHQRGHFMAIGQHRCLWCGYIGTGGIMDTERIEPNVKHNGNFNP